VSPPRQDIIDRIGWLTPAALADDVVAAVTDLGGEAQRADIIDRALDIGGWTEEERAVVSWYTGAARRYHLRTLADYSVTVCNDRGVLSEGSARGRWRLAAPTGVSPHPHGRVFTAGVGVVGAPVGDDWSAAEQDRLYLSQRSTQLSRGDHVFALGAGRHSVVLGLFEVISAGTVRRPHPRDPERWPFAFDVRAIASVPPVDARGVDGVTAPRGSANVVRSPEVRAALYAAIDGHAVDPDVHQGVRRARPFDPERPPTPAERPAAADAEEAATLQEKASQGHHEILRHLHGALDAAGWGGLEEIPSAIDLRGTSPTGTGVIFEAKTISESNELTQCRSALAQLLEYRLEYGHPDDSVCVAVDSALSARRLDFLDRLGVAAVFIGADGRIRPLNGSADAVISGGL